jgi:hypothetical protein
MSTNLKPSVILALRVIREILFMLTLTMKYKRIEHLRSVTRLLARGNMVRTRDMAGACMGMGEGHLKALLGTIGMCTHIHARVWGGINVHGLLHCVISNKVTSLREGTCVRQLQQARKA